MPLFRSRQFGETSSKNTPPSVSPQFQKEKTTEVVVTRIEVEDGPEVDLALLSEEERGLIEEVLRGFEQTMRSPPPGFQADSPRLGREGGTSSLGVFK